MLTLQYLDIMAGIFVLRRRVISGFSIASKTSFNTQRVQGPNNQVLGFCLTGIIVQVLG